MNFLELASKRYSVRDYQEQQIEQEKLLQVLEAGRLAPSAVNKQPWQFIVITNEQLKQKVLETYPRDWIKTAPTIIAICVDHNQSWIRKDGKDHADIDAAIAIDHMTLAATSLGLGTCWVCAFDNVKCHQALGLSDNIEVVALLPIGYPSFAAEEAAKEKDKRQARKALEEIVIWK